MSAATNSQVDPAITTSIVANRFHGKIAIVTGAASGTGRTVLLRLVEEGASALGIDINEDGLKETKEMSSCSERMSTATFSVTDEEKVIEKVNEYVTSQGHLDVLVNVAGILRVGSLVDMSMSEFRSVLDTNLIGTVLMCRACLPHLVLSKVNIVNTSSTAALHGHPFMSAYAAGKGAIIAFTKSLSREYLLQDVRVTVIAPGGINTPIHNNVRFPLDINHPLFNNLRMPNGRFGRTEDIAGVVAMLASKDGDVIRIDGGVHS